MAGSLAISALGGKHPRASPGGPLYARRARSSGTSRPRPVADDREAGQRGRVEGLVDDPVAHHVLDALGGHAHERDQEVATVVAVVQRPELGGARGRGQEPAHATMSTILPVWASLSWRRRGLPGRRLRRGA